ncbi:MAG: Gfo/Idh/MocA family oxidoreductase [Patescibacteria group bacterium]
MLPNVSVIGAGPWGKNLIRNLHSLDALHSVCDQNSETLGIVRTGYQGVRTFQSADDILSDPTVDAVMIATPSEQHVSFAEQAIRAGKDVFVEKPLALSVLEGEKLVSLAHKQNRILMVGHVLQYHPAVRKLKELMDSGELGELRYLHAQRLNFGKFRVSEDSLWSFAPHDISLALEFAGCEPLQAVCHGSDVLIPHQMDTTFSHITFPGDIHFYLYVSWLYPQKQQRFVVIGSKQMAVFDDQAESKLVLYPYSVEWGGSVHNGFRGEGASIEIEDTEPLRLECEHFLECIATRRAPKTNGEEGLRVLQVLDACQRSLNNGAPAEICQKPSFTKRQSLTKAL